ncbi:MAG TPA: rhodanese-like domain-containing protein [Geminicoccaceae bacterium]
MEVETFDRWRRDDPPPVVVDVREPWEVLIGGFPEAALIPLGDLAGRVAEVPADRPVVVVCHTGLRSLRAARFLRGQGRPLTSSLRGGVEAWALRIDPAMPRY